MKLVNLLIRPADEGYFPVVFNTTHPETTVLHLHNPKAAKLQLLPFYTQKARHKDKQEEEAVTKSESAQKFFC